MKYTRQIPTEPGWYPYKAEIRQDGKNEIHYGVVHMRHVHFSLPPRLFADSLFAEVYNHDSRSLDDDIFEMRVMRAAGRGNYKARIVGFGPRLELEDEA